MSHDTLSIPRFDLSSLPPIKNEEKPHRQVRACKLLKVPGTSISLPYQEYRNAGGRYFMLFYYQAGKRVRESRTSFAKLKSRAEEIATAIQNGTAAMARFTEQDRASYLAACETLPAGKNIVQACAEWAEAFKLLKGKVNPVEAARYYLQQHPCDLIERTVEKIRDEFFKKGKRGTKWKRVLEGMLDLFVEKFTGRTLPNITTRELEDWLDSIAGGLRTRRNYRNALKSLFNFAQARSYAPRDWDILSAVSDPEPAAVRVNLYSPDELLRMLNKASSYKAGRKLVPLIAITAFAGVRHGEMNEEKVEHLDWQDFDWDANQIRIEPDAAKTGSARVVDMPDNLVAWLQDYRKASGKVVPLENTSSALCRLRHKAGITGDKRNALRKSFITYKLALSGSIDHVAGQAGNSPGIIKKNYNAPDLRRRAAAKRWFDIWPTTADILQLNFKLA